MRVGERRGKASLSKFHIILRAMMVSCAAAVVLFTALLLYDRIEYWQGEATYGQMRSELYQHNTDTKNEAGALDAMASASLLKVNFAPLKEINNDVVGWIRSEGSTINYPIVRGENNEYYLSHLFNREQNKLGSIFMDYRNNSDFSDANTVIYGHNMKDGSMFSSLTKYQDQNYYDSFPTMALYTPNGDFEIELLAGIVADGNYEFVCFTFEDDRGFLDYVNDLKEKSTFKSDVTVEPNDQIVTLCTCSYEFNNARYALCGKLIPLNQ